MPTVSVASLSTPDSENIAPMRVVIRKSQSLLGLLSVTSSFVGETALASATTSIALASDVVQSFFTRLIEKAASDASKASPLVNFAFGTSSKV